MGNLITGTHHVALKCASVEKYQETLHFYMELLGLEKIRSWGEGSGSGIMLNTGDGILEIFAEGSESTQTGSVNHYALATMDVDECIRIVREAGYQVTREPNDIVIPAEEAFPARIAFCVGPNGESIEFFCEK